LLSLQAVVGVMSLTGDRGALRRALEADRVPTLSPPFVPPAGPIVFAGFVLAVRGITSE
jgi:hypothetical protein